MQGVVVQAGSSIGPFTDYEINGLRLAAAPERKSNFLPDAVWPDETELLIDATKRKSWKEFVVIELLVEVIEWSQVAGKA